MVSVVITILLRTMDKSASCSLLKLLNACSDDWDFESRSLKAVMRAHYFARDDLSVICGVLRYYKDFLTEDCAKCGRIMLHGLPPFCIDHSMLEIDKSGMGPEAKIPKYHVECFPHNL